MVEGGTKEAPRAPLVDVPPSLGKVSQPPPGSTLLLEAARSASLCSPSAAPHLQPPGWQALLASHKAGWPAVASSVPSGGMSVLCLGQLGNREACSDTEQSLLFTVTQHGARCGPWQALPVTR